MFEPKQIVLFGPSKCQNTFLKFERRKNIFVEKINNNRKNGFSRFLRKFKGTPKMVNTEVVDLLFSTTFRLKFFRYNA